MRTSHNIERVGLKPAVLFGQLRSGDFDTPPTHKMPPRSPTLGPRSPGIASTPCAFNNDNTGESMVMGRLALTPVAHPLHGGERLRRPFSNSADSPKWSSLKLQSAHEVPATAISRQQESHPGREADCIATRRLPCRSMTLLSMCKMRAMPRTD